jgi:hypothetical protein
MTEHLVRAGESLRTLITVNGLLAGFSFSGAMGLLKLPSGTKAFEIAFISLLLATFLFLMVMTGAWAANEWILDQQDQKYDGKAFYSATTRLFPAALAVFSVGVSAAGFIHSIWAGIFAVCAAASFLVYFGLATVTLGLQADKKPLDSHE